MSDACEANALRTFIAAAAWQALKDSFAPLQFYGVSRCNCLVRNAMREWLRSVARWLRAIRQRLHFASREMSRCDVAQVSEAGELRRFTLP
ncbi:hypothetical protein AAFG07_30535 [Bradyrhizobium sp. B097]|uniref:hypothetical protein n=1 Tax=Bradyrhizobium sp. B097 TaxID=3140244 RepID=UPI0031842C43